MSAFLAQVEVAPQGLASSQFTLLIWPVLVYVLLTIASNVLENRGHPRAGTVGDAAFAVLLLLAVYVLVLLITAISTRLDLLSRMLGVLALVIAFFAVLLGVLFLLSVVFGLIGRTVRRDRRVTAPGAAQEQPPPAAG